MAMAALQAADDGDDAAIGSFALVQRDESMNRIIPKGALVMCEPVDGRPGRDGAIVLAGPYGATGFEAAIVREVHSSDGRVGLYPLSDDGGFPPIRLAGRGRDRDQGGCRRLSGVALPRRPCPLRGGRLGRPPAGHQTAYFVQVLSFEIQVSPHSFPVLHSLAGALMLQVLSLETLVSLVSEFHRIPFS